MNTYYSPPLLHTKSPECQGNIVVLRDGRVNALCKRVKDLLERAMQLLRGWNLWSWGWPLSVWFCRPAGFQPGRLGFCSRLPGHGCGIKLPKIMTIGGFVIACIRKLIQVSRAIV